MESVYKSMYTAIPNAKMKAVEINEINTQNYQQTSSFHTIIMNYQLHLFTCRNLKFGMREGHDEKK